MKYTYDTLQLCRDSEKKGGGYWLFQVAKGTCPKFKKGKWDYLGNGMYFLSCCWTSISCVRLDHGEGPFAVIVSES